MKKVLLIAYHYPPSTAVGAIRPAKFVHYLPMYEWEPTVLTIAVPDAAALDLHNVNGEICRIAEWPHPLKWYERFREQQAMRKGRGKEHALYVKSSYDDAMVPATRGVRELKRWLLAFMWLPDRETGWVIPAIAKGLRLIREKQIDHIITTGPPFSCHLVGLALKKLMGVKWIADFRDPWSLKHKPPAFRNRLTDLLEGRLITSVMHQADIVVSNTESWTRELCDTENLSLRTRPFGEFSIKTTRRKNGQSWL